MGTENLVTVLVCVLAVMAAFGEGYRLGKVRGGGCYIASRQREAGGLLRGVKSALDKEEEAEVSEAARALEKDMRNIDNYATAVAQEEVV